MRAERPTKLIFCASRETCRVRQTNCRISGATIDGRIWQRFIEELRTDFAFLARQKRITIDNYVDDSVLTMLDKRNKGVDAVIGASLKDLGKKWFGFSKMGVITDELLSKI